MGDEDGAARPKDPRLHGGAFANVSTSFPHYRPIEAIQKTALVTESSHTFRMVH